MPQGKGGGTSPSPLQEVPSPKGRRERGGKVDLRLGRGGASLAHREAQGEFFLWEKKRRRHKGPRHPKKKRRDSPIPTP